MNNATTKKRENQDYLHQFHAGKFCILRKELHYLFKSYFGPQNANNYALVYWYIASNRKPKFGYSNIAEQSLVNKTWLSNHIGDISSKVDSFNINSMLLKKKKWGNLWQFCRNENIYQKLLSVYEKDEAVFADREGRLYYGNHKYLDEE